MLTTTQPRAIGPAAEPSQDRLAFLRALYGAAHTGFWFNITTFPDGKTRPFSASEPGISDAANYIATVDDGTRHVFTSMAIFDHPITQGRGKAADAAALTCLWIDVDVKPGASADLSVAHEIVAAIPLRPSLLTSSGGGLHAVYIFREPLSLASDAARADVLDLLSRWKATVMAYAAERGGAVDKGTFDVARVMRVSGTSNPKSQPPLPAYIIEDSGLRYAESDFDPFLRDAISGVATASRAAAPMVSLDGVNIVPQETLLPAFASALETDTRLRLTWKRGRTDFADQSHSSYSLSLASSCVSLGLTDEQIAYVLCTWRTQEGASEKDRDWYARTIAKARERGSIGSETAALIAQVAEGVLLDRDTTLRTMSDLIGARIAAVKRYPDVKKAVYRVVVGDNAEIELGDAAACRDQKIWANVLWDANVRISAMKAPVWSNFCDMMLQVIEDVDPDSVTERGEAEGWVNEYLATRQLEPGIKAHEAWEHKRPYRDTEGRIRIYADDLLKSINKPRQKALSKGRDYNPAMRSIGAVPEYADLRKYGIRGARVWVLPLGFGDDDE